MYTIFKNELIINCTRISAGYPYSKIHIINVKNDMSYCGYDSYRAEISLEKSGYKEFTENICQKCLKLYFKNQENNK